MAGFMAIKVRREVYIRLQDLQEEISQKRGYKVSLAQLVEASVGLIEGLESMESEDDIAAFHGTTEGD